MQMIVHTNIGQFIRSLDKAQLAIVNRTAFWVQKLTEYAEKKMKYHAPRTQRSTRKLKDSIDSEFHTSIIGMYGIAYVPEKIRYQFVIESGRSAEGHGKRVKWMKFPVENWKRGMRNPNILRCAHKGYFIFHSVKQGKIKGRYFVLKSYKDLLNFYEKNKHKILIGYAKDLFIGTYARAWIRV